MHASDTWRAHSMSCARTSHSACFSSVRLSVGQPYSVTHIGLSGVSPAADMTARSRSAASSTA